MALVVKILPTNAGHIRDAGSIPGLGNPLETEMATYSSILVWRLQWTEEPAGLPSMGMHRIKHNSFFRFSVLVKSYGICFSLCVLFHLA